MISTLRNLPRENRLRTYVFVCGLIAASLLFLFPKTAYAEVGLRCVNSRECGDGELCQDGVCVFDDFVRGLENAIDAGRDQPANLGPRPEFPKPESPKDKKSAVVQGIDELDPIKATPEEFIGRALKGMLGFVGTIALVMIVYAGVTWMLAGVRGSANDIKKAQDTMFWAVIGLTVIFSSYAIVHFIVNNIAP